MTLRRRQRQLIRRSFAEVRTCSAAVSLLFYSRLFELDPSLRPMFRGDMEIQAHAFSAMLDLAVAGLDHPDQIAAVLRRLGTRHSVYGVEPRHYALVKDALLWTLERALGDAFGADARAAWSEIFDQIAHAMQAQH